MMMMSLFSPVEALCAESIGQKLGFSFATATKADENHAPESDRKAAAASVPYSFSSVYQGMNKDVANRSSSSSSTSPPPLSNSKKASTIQRRRRPRFAPELDGVFCFETIVPY